MRQRRPIRLTHHPGDLARLRRDPEPVGRQVVQLPVGWQAVHELELVDGLDGAGAKPIVAQLVGRHREARQDESPVQGGHGRPRHPGLHLMRLVNDHMASLGTAATACSVNAASAATRLGEKLLPVLVTLEDVLAWPLRIPFLLFTLGQKKNSWPQ